MQRKSPKKKENDPGNLTNAEIFYLIKGFPYWLSDDNFEIVNGKHQLKNPFGSEEKAREAYFKHKDEVFAREGQESSFAYATFPEGTKPWAFAKFEETTE